MSGEKIVSNLNTKKTPANANFKVGGKVRLEHNVKDNDYPDMPISG